MTTQPNILRILEIIPDYAINADGSCLIKMGNTHVLCTATIEESVPRFLKNTGSGWVTAEYSMLPRATATRTQREITHGKPSGRNQEIQRLIGRALRSCINLQALGERQIILDCDVLNADGGTRCAAVNGAYVALVLAVKKLLNSKKIRVNPIKYQIGAISCGIVRGDIVVDLDYMQDSNADVDGNFIFNEYYNLIEIQSSAEKAPFSRAKFLDMLTAAESAMAIIFQEQQKILSI